MEKRLLEGRFGVYRLSGLIERTSWCNVYRAHRVQKRLFAAREIYVAREVFVHFEDPRQRALAIQKFEEHVAPYMDVTHPALVRVIDYMTRGHYHYTLFEYTGGTRLGFLLDHQHIPCSEALMFQLMVDVVGGLRYIHKKGLVFGDISPSSIIIAPEGQARLTDYGLSRFLLPSTPDGPLLGTPGYAAPELYDRDMLPSSQCDLYSLGAVAWHGLTLREPAEAGIPLPPVGQINPEVTQWMADFIDRLVDPAPPRRFPDAEAVYDAMRAYDPSIEQAPPTGLLTRLLRRALGKSSGT